VLAARSGSHGKVLVLLLKCLVLEVADVIIDGGDVCLKFFGENDPQDVEMAHGEVSFFDDRTFRRAPMARSA
jgi:hypothetical protein